MTAEFEWGGVSLACGLLALMFLVPTFVLVRDVKRKERAERTERTEREGEQVFSGGRRDRSADGEW